MFETKPHRSCDNLPRPLLSAQTSQDELQRQIKHSLKYNSFPLDAPILINSMFLSNQRLNVLTVLLIGLVMISTNDPCPIKSTSSPSRTQTPLI